MDPDADLVMIREPEDTELEKEWHNNVKNRYPDFGNMAKNR